MTLTCKNLVRSLMLGGAAFAVAVPVPALGQIILAQAQDLSSLSIEELAALEITTVSRRAEPLNEAAAAIFVITRDDIRRSGAESIPDALRLAPNLHVARMSANGYGISARGFNHSTGTSNKLLVLIDGRSVYTSLYSGVFWDIQNFPLDDVERIEVISGPGGTLWGANAVNGVINIITRSSADSQGVMARAGYGNLERKLTARFGGTLMDGLTYRVYAMGFQRGPLQTATGSDANDEWETLQGGFRMDYTQAGNEISLLGDVYSGWSEPIGTLTDGEVNGGNIVARWRHTLSDNANFNLQAYYDWNARTVTSGIEDFHETLDVEGDFSFALGTRHQIVLGGGYRANWDEFTPGPGTSFLTPPRRRLELANAFLQDEIALQENLSLTLGIKLEHNSYTGLEYMPSGRVSWALTETDFLWAAVSRAVRTPSRFDRDLFNGVLVAGGPDFMSETLVAYEIGYRGQPVDGLSFSISGFYNVYDDLRTAESPAVGFFPLTIGNEMEGETYGVELWGNYSVRDWWRVSAGLSTLQKDLRLKPGSRDLFGVAFAGNDPEYQLLLRSSMNVTDALEIDLMMRAVDGLPSPQVPGYVELDARLGWHLSDALELSLAGSNLLNARHEEFRNASAPVRKVPRAFHISARWSL